MKNKEHLRTYKNDYDKQRKADDPVYKLSKNLRTRLSNAFRDAGYTKKSKTAKLLGCEWEKLKLHTEQQFTNGMTWENYGEWHIDHVKPLASATNEEEMIKLSHYKNLQPLWAEDNLRKSDKMPK